MIAKKDGFTLFESLVVLFILSLLILLPTVSLNKVTESIQVDLTFKELESNISLMQNNALLMNERSEVQVFPSQNMIQFRIYDGNQYGEHPLEKQIYLSKDFIEIKNERLAIISFQRGTGNITVNNGNSWSIHFTTTKGEYELVFQLGSGRFEVRKK